MLRTAVGLTLVARGLAYFTDATSLRFETGVIGILLVLSGASLVTGFFTPMAGVLAVLGIGASAYSRLHIANMLGTWWATINLIVSAAALICLGPGAFSLDAFLFGWREIFIPTSRPKEH